MLQIVTFVKLLYINILQVLWFATTLLSSWLYPLFLALMLVHNSYTLYIIHYTLYMVIGIEHWCTLEVIIPIIRDWITLNPYSMLSFKQRVIHVSLVSYKKMVLSFNNVLFMFYLLIIRNWLHCLHNERMTITIIIYTGIYKEWTIVFKRATSKKCC